VWLLCLVVPALHRHAQTAPTPGPCRTEHARRQPLQKRPSTLLHLHKEYLIGPTLCLFISIAIVSTLVGCCRALKSPLALRGGAHHMLPFLCRRTARPSNPTIVQSRAALYAARLDARAACANDSRPRSTRTALSCTSRFRLNFATRSIESVRFSIGSHVASLTG
jgi:hypothetical protein